MRVRLLCALGASLLLHAVAIVVASRLPFAQAAAPAFPPPIEAQLLTQASALPDDTLLKNTLKPAESEPPREPRPAHEAPDRALQASPREPATPKEDTPQRASDDAYYPREAVEQGLEGDVIVLIELDGQGHVRDATIASSSGHALLDAAALRAVRSSGTVFPGAAGQTLLLPVRFRLR